MMAINDLAPGDQVIVISRVFDAPRELVFEAFTDPDHVAEFWGPKSTTTTACAVDLRVGGEFRVEMQGPDGTTYPCTGVYREIVAPERIVYDSTSDDSNPCGAGLPPRSVVTLTFTAEDDRTKLTIHTLLQSVTDRDAAVKGGFNAGWADSLDRLAALVLRRVYARQQWLEQQRSAALDLLDRYRSDSPLVQPENFDPKKPD
jgi:uncharacterized protein YndB with AHSA1/START domain